MKQTVVDGAQFAYEDVGSGEPVVSGATHLLQLENPAGVADALAAFLGRHPIEAL